MEIEPERLSEEERPVSQRMGRELSLSRRSKGWGHLEMAQTEERSEEALVVKWVNEEGGHGKQIGAAGPVRMVRSFSLLHLVIGDSVSGQRNLIWFPWLCGSLSKALHNPPALIGSEFVYLKVELFDGGLSVWWGEESSEIAVEEHLWVQRRSGVWFGA